jgi:UDP-N-acetylmuramoylalanine--D-glutamate ligase
LKGNRIDVPGGFGADVPGGFNYAALSGAKVTVMGLGIHGGGLASARFFARRGASVTVTDLRSADVLQPAMEQLQEYPVRYVLGRHDEDDFAHADLVIKNPAVAPTSPFLRSAREHGVAIETDLSVFFSLSRNPVIAVTGSKGKSTTASAIAFGLSQARPGTRLGGNITVSPLSFVDELEEGAPVVLELSSWQLGDLRGRGILKPAVSAFTVILPDHLDKYAGMAEYVADKKVIFQEQDPGQSAVFNLDDPWQSGFPGETRARPFSFSLRELPPGMCGAWQEGGVGIARITPGAPEEQILATTLLPGAHNRQNLLCAGLVLLLYGMPAAGVRDALSRFPGVEHRLELFLTWKGVKFYNDSAATIPHATAAAVRAVPGPVVLITGGTDKNIDFLPLAEVAHLPRAIILLSGTGTEKIRALLASRRISADGPFDALSPAVQKAIDRALELRTQEGSSILFSPGCTSFGMFLNEFDRGRRFKETAAALTSSALTSAGSSSS